MTRNDRYLGFRPGAARGRRPRIAAGVGALLLLALGSCGPTDGNPPASTYSVTVAITPPGWGSVSLDPAAGPYAAGQLVTLTATAAPGYQFDRWQGGTDGTTNPVQITVNGDVSVEAVFAVAGGGDKTVNENLRVLPDTVVVTTEADGRTVLSGDAMPASLEPGALIVSTRGDGKLLRVVSIPTTANGQVTMTTEQAALTDLIRNGSINLTVPFDPNTAVMEMPAAAVPGGRKRVRFTRTGDRTAAFTTTDHSIELEDWGKVSLDQLTIEVDPDFDVSASIEASRLQHLRVAAGTGFHLSIDASVEAYKISELLKKEETIGKVKWPNPAGIVLIGGVPVVYQVYLEVKVGAQVTFGGVGVITAGLDFDTQATLGAEYTQGAGWDLIDEKTSTFTPHTPDWGISPITAQIYVQPEFGMTFYGVVGPSLSWKEYLELTGAYKHNVLGAELARGSECDFNLNFKIMDGLPSYKYSHNLFSARQVLLARMLADVDPADLGSASISPGDLVWGLYAFTQSLDVTARADSGYEVAGWTVHNLIGSGGKTAHTTELHDEPVDGSKLFVAGIVPEGYGDTWTGAGTGSGSPTYTIATSVFPSDAGEIQLFPGTAPYAWGINVLVTAKPTSQCEFHHWEGSLSGNELTGVLTMNANKSLRAVFASTPPRTLDVPSDYPTLQDALNAATYNDIIHIEEGTHSGTGFHDITIPRDHIIIQGAGADTSIIDLGDSAPLGWLDDVNVTFQNLQIRRGSGDLGGALRLTGDTRAAFRNCTFRACKGRNGGAVYVSDIGTIVSFENCLFESNQATSSGGALNLSNTPKDEAHVPVLANCTFTGNTADSSGGGIAAGQKCRLTNCSFNQNAASAGGGGSFGGHAVLTGCTFNANTATNGGALFADEFTSITKCSFTHNVAERDGGGMKANDGVSIQNCTLENNQAGQDGGAIHADRITAGKTLFIVGCGFGENSAGENGGGIWCDGTEVSQVELTANTAGRRGGGIYANHSQISSGYLAGNRAGTAAQPAYSEGGGIYLQQTNVANCQLTGNEAIEGNGGGIYAQGSLSDTAVPPVITDVYAAYNSAKNGGGLGGDLEVHVFSSTFEANEASYRGGGIDALRGPLVSLCSIADNSAQEGGGARIAQGSILSSTILRNDATRVGGGLHLFESSARNCTVGSNTAATEGGGIWTGVGCSIADCAITYNTLTDTTATGGAGLACHGAPALSGLTIRNNTPTNCNSDCPCPSP